MEERPLPSTQPQTNASHQVIRRPQRAWSFTQERNLPRLALALTATLCLFLAVQRIGGRKIRTERLQLLATVPVSSPSPPCIDPEMHTVYVASETGNTVLALDPETLAVRARIPVGVRPCSLGINPRMRRLYVSNRESGDVSVIDVAANRKLVDVYVGGLPETVAVNPEDGSVLVANPATGYVDRIDGSTNTLCDPIPALCAARFVAAFPEQRWAFVLNPDGGQIIECDYAITARSTRRLDTDALPSCAAEWRRRLYAANAGSDSVSVYDLDAQQRILSVRVGREPCGIAVDEVTQRVIVANHGSSDLSALTREGRPIARWSAPDARMRYIAVDSGLGRIYTCDDQSDGLHVCAEPGAACTPPSPDIPGASEARAAAPTLSVTRGVVPAPTRSTRADVAATITVAQAVVAATDSFGRRLRKRPSHMLRRQLYPLDPAQCSVKALSALRTVVHTAGTPSLSESSAAATESANTPRKSLDPGWQSVIPFDESDKGGEPTAITTDSDGNLYVCGFVDTTQTDVDFFTVKYSSSGHLLWQRRYNGPGNDLDRGRALAVDHAGNVYVTGESDGGVGNGVGRHDCWDYATVKYDKNGNVIWVRRYAGPGNNADLPVKLCLDGDGNIYVTGSSFGGNQTGYDWATIKYAPDGRQLWVARYNGPSSLDDLVTDMAVSPGGDVFVTGTSVMRQLDGPRTVHTHEVATATVCYDRNGALRWQRTFMSTGCWQTVPKAIGLDARNDVYIAATSGPYSVLGDYPRYVNLLKYTASGDLAWKREERAPADGFVTARGLVAEHGSICLLCRNDTQATGHPDSTAFLTVSIFSPDGTRLWFRSLQDARSGCTGVTCCAAFAPSGAVYVSGCEPAPASGAPVDSIVTLKLSRYSPDCKQRILPLHLIGQEAQSLISIDSTGSVYVARAYAEHGRGYVAVLKFSP